MNEKTGGLRLNQFLAHTGAASRRKAEELILSRLVTVNGQVVDHPGMQIDPRLDVVRLRGHVIQVEEALTLVIHKPKGVICSRSDPEGRKTLFDLLPKKMVAHSSLQSVGRLDFDSSGVMVLTNDGILHRLLEHPSTGIKRVYQVKAKGELEATRTKALLAGVALEDGIGQAIGVEMLRFSGGISRFLVTLQEGRNREVRRMCAAVGLEVLDLRRLSYGPITLGTLPSGSWRETTLDEDRILFKMKGKALKKASAATTEEPPAGKRRRPVPSGGPSSSGERRKPVPNGRPSSTDNRRRPVPSGGPSSTGERRRPVPNGRPSSSGERRKPVPNGGPSSTGDRRGPVSNGRPSSTGERRRPVPNGRPSSSGERQRLVPSGRPSSSGERRRPEPNGRPSSTDNRRKPVRSGGPSSTDNRRKPVSSGRPSSSDNRRGPVSSGRPPSSGNRRKPVPSGGPPSSGNRRKPGGKR